MKLSRSILLAAFACTAVLLSAQTPRSFSYQAVMRDPATGHPLVDQAATVRFALHQGTVAGTEVYAEQHAVTSSAQGLFSLQVGRGTAPTGDFSTIDWRNGPYFLEVDLDVGNTGSFTVMGTQELLSVPYALQAERSNIPDGDAVGQIAHWNGNAWVVDSGLYVHHRRFGIGDQQPEAPLSIVHRNILKTFFAVGDKPTQSQRGFGLTTDSVGFGLVDGPVDSLTNRLFVQSGTGHVGIGTVEPQASLSLKSRDRLKVYFETGDIPSQQDFAFVSDTTGFGIDQGTAASASSRFFISSSTGNIGLGTTTPAEKYHIHGIHLGGHVGMRLSNGAATSNQGWVLGHLDDGTTAERAGAFALFEESSTEQERITVRPGGNVGINEPLPYATLHVTRPVEDPHADASLDVNSGIAVFGPITKNVVVDYRGLQARQLVAGTTSISGSPSTLHLQRLGGDLLIHGDDASDDTKLVLTSNGKVGVGTITPHEKLHLNGALVIGTSSSASPAEGTIRYTGSDFEGRKGGAWVSLTSQATSDGYWQSGGEGSIAYNSTNAKVGIGVDVPNAALHVVEHGTTSGDITGVTFTNTSTTSGNGSRVGLQVETSGAWGSTGEAKSIGLHVSSSGASNPNANLAAVLNGNVVIGDVRATANEVGTSGTNVLAIQNGSAPQAPPTSNSGMPDAGVQLFSSSDATGTSVFHLMNGNGDVITLARQNPLFEPNNDPVNPVYDANTAAIIENMRTRINELEARLRALGLLTP